jgi:hypothetical protein
MKQQIDELWSTMQENIRLRMGAWLILAIVTFYALLLVDDYQDNMANDYQQVLKRYQRVQDIKEQGYWPERAAQARSTVVQLQSGMWQADSSALAQANIQTWLTQKIARHKIENLKQNVVPAKEVASMPGVWKVSAELKGAISRFQLIKLLRDIELNSKLLSVEQLEVKGNKDVQRLSMLVSAYFLVAQPAGTGKAG